MDSSAFLPNRAEPGVIPYLDIPYLVPMVQPRADPSDYYYLSSTSTLVPPNFFAAAFDTHCNRKVM
jgi:hypothetical protein